MTIQQVQMAVIGAAHGVKGEVRIKSFTADPMALQNYGQLHSADGRIFEIVELRPQGNMLVARFKGVDDRNAAESLNGTGLFVDRSVLPGDLEEEEFYHADLIGLMVKDDTGTAVGKVSAVHNFGGGDILAVKPVAGAEILIPFTQAAVTAVAVDQGCLIINPVAAGLIGGEAEKNRPGRRQGDGKK